MNMFPFIKYALAASIGAMVTLVTLVVRDAVHPESGAVVATHAAGDDRGARAQQVVSVRAEQRVMNDANVTAQELAEAQVVALTQQVSEQTDVIETLRLKNRLSESIARAVIEEATARASGKSLFKNLREVGDFIAYINYRSADIANAAYTPNQGEAGFEVYKNKLDELTRDVAVVTQDPLLLNALRSGDPKLITQAQSGYLTSSLGLNAAQEKEVSDMLEAGYTLGIQKGLDLKSKPTGDATEWEAGRAQLNEVVVNNVEKLLTPKQLKQFTDYGYDDLMFNLTITIKTNESGPKQ